LYLSSGHADKAGSLALFRRALEQDHLMVKLQPQDGVALNHLASNLFRIAAMEDEGGDRPSAIAHFLEGKAALAPLLGQNPPDLQTKYVDTMLTSGLIDCYLDEKDTSNAKVAFAQLAQTSQLLLKADPVSPNYLRLAAETDIQHARLYVLSGDLLAASASFKAGSNRLKEIADKDPGMAKLLLNLQQRYARTLVDSGYFEQAIDVLKPEIDYVSTHLGSSSEYLLHAQTKILYKIATAYEAEADAIKENDKKRQNIQEDGQRYYKLAKDYLDQLAAKKAASPEEAEELQDIEKKLFAITLAPTHSPI
jgi:hypothetical protein